LSVYFPDLYSFLSFVPFLIFSPQEGRENKNDEAFGLQILGILPHLTGNQEKGQDGLVQER
jgi:hypothetical protein